MLSLKRNSWLVVATGAICVIGCGGGGTAAPSGGGGSESVGGTSTQGGAPATGGDNNPGTGGTTTVDSSGGAPATGGTVSVAGGGSPQTGGSVATGGKAGTSTGGSAPTGGSVATGGKVGTSTGGSVPTGGSVATGGKAGTSTGGSVPTGGASTTGTKATGGAATGGASTTGTKATGGAATGGAATGGSTGTPPSGTGPCDIYAAANTPCSAAYSTTRVLYSTYHGPLYQVRVGGSNTGSGGTFTDIGVISSGIYADGAAQDAVCSGSCSVSKLYDQSGKGNDLVVAKKGCYTGGNASKDDYESNAKTKSVNINGHKVYALYMLAQEGYRNNTPSGTPKNGAAQGTYEVADGTHPGTACCWDFGLASTDNCNQGTMNALFFGNANYWDKGTGNGPWFMADLEGGVWAGGNQTSTGHTNSSLPSSTMPFAFGLLSHTPSPSNYKIKVGDATTGSLTIANNSALPKSLSTPGGIILGIGGDNSNGSAGTFFEGAITTGQPSDASDTAVFENVQAAGYGK